MQLLVLHGPNLNLLGTREPETYGRLTLADIEQQATKHAETLGYALSGFQTNAEHALIERIHAAKHDGTGFIIINPGALGHYSWSLRDALDAFPGTRIEIHLSNPAGREDFRRTSTLARVVNGTIAGFGSQSYDLAVEAVARLRSA
jgi:3-dehydroquinate dehydratase-2